MNEVIKTLQSHRSIRNYTGEAVQDEHLRAIIQSAIQGPSTMNGQQWSILLVKDQAKKDKIAALCNNQEWISKSSVFMVFLMDFSKIARKMEEKGIPFENVKSIEAIMVGSVDVGIAFAGAMAAAESLGYGIVPIGAVRREPYEMIELLKLPKYVYPVLGMCIGVEAGNQAMKPRLPYEAMVSVDEYEAPSDEVIATYDQAIKEYLAIRSKGENTPTWSDSLSTRLGAVYFPKVKGSLKQQGFTDEV